MDHSRRQSVRGIESDVDPGTGRPATGLGQAISRVCRHLEYSYWERVDATYGAQLVPTVVLR